MPVVQRGLKDRSGDIKKRAARIVGNLSSLANDPRDMAPYVALLLPQLQASLVDPLPEVRATSARAVGTLVRGMGPAAFADLVPWLVARLASEASSVERSGAAQGLAEVLAVQGDAALSSLLPRVLEGARARSAAAREGHVTLFKYLPGCMPAAFRAHLATVLPAVLLGLADEAEGVRDAALSAARVAVDLYATSALELLLPAVEAGIMNANWRIRQSSIELLGDLLFKVVGVCVGGGPPFGFTVMHEEGWDEEVVAAITGEPRRLHLGPRGPDQRRLAQSECTRAIDQHHRPSNHTSWLRRWRAPRAASSRTCRTRRTRASPSSRTAGPSPRPWGTRGGGGRGAGWGGSRGN